MSESFFRRGRDPIVFFAAINLFLIASISPAALPSRHQSTFYIARTAADTLFVLPVPWVMPDSLHLRSCTSPLVAFEDYRLIEPGNRIWLFRPLPKGDTLFVDFGYVPIPLPRTYLRRTLRELRGMSTSDSARPRQIVVSQRNEDVTAWSRLQKSGSLIRSVQIGTDQDLQLESALNLTVVGRLGEHVEVTAALSDQSTPLQPEGTTENLNELDKVFVEVKGPRFAATLGDHVTEFGGGTYDYYQRKLSGVRGSYADSVLNATAGAASSRGKFFSNEFLGQDANQGPYLLKDEDGNSGFVVLAGTEQVWLNGFLLRRGETNDYVVDYARGEITFTARRLINAASRIVVDFQYSNENFERVFFNASSAATPKNRIGTIVATYITEADNREQIIGAALGDEETNALRNAGDQAESAVVESADSAGVGFGDYVRSDTLFEGSTYSQFVFSPRDSLNQSTGTWNVVFDEFGENAGDYLATANPGGIVYFYWVGPNRGRYRPFRRLPLPQKSDLADVRVSTQPIRGLTLSAEGALSQRDRNTFSALNDDDNDGMAGTVAAQWRRQDASLFGLTFPRAGVTVSVKARDKQFNEINRSPEVEFSRDWNLERNRGSAELQRETVVELSPIKRVGLSANYGDLQRSDVTSAVRRGAEISFGDNEKFRAAAGLTSINSADSTLARMGTWRRYKAEANGRLARLSPLARFEHENKRDKLRVAEQGTRFTEWQGGSGIRLNHELDLFSTYLRRDEESLNGGGFARAATADEIENALGWDRASVGSAALRFVHREKRFERLDSADIKSDAGQLDVQLSPDASLLDGSLTYKISRSRSADEVLVAVQVTPGTGNYRKEGEQFIPDDQGDYILVPRATGTFQPASDLALNTEFALRFDELKKESAAAWVRMFSTETELTVEERTRSPLEMRLILLDPGKTRGDSTLYGNLQVRQDLHWKRLSRKVALRTRYRGQRSLQNQYLNGGQERSLDEYSLRVRAQYAATLRGESNLEHSRELFSYANSAIPSRQIQRIRAAEDVTYAFSQRWEFGAEASGEEVQDERSATQASLRELRPHVTLTMAGRGRIDAEFAWNHATSNRATIPFELGRGANRGENLRWLVRGTYEFGQNLSGSLSYTARRDAGEKVFQTGRIEARASL